MKKILSSLLTLALVFTCLWVLSLKANASTVASGWCGSNVRWDLNNTGTLAIYGTGPMRDYDYSYNAPWYSNRSKIETVIIGPGVTSIGEEAFFGCQNLASVIIPDSVTSIGGYAFVACYSLTSVDIPDSITSIGNAAFNNCGLTTVIIPERVTIINSLTFHGCGNLVSVIIPEGVTAIDSSAFSKCTSLIDVYYKGSTVQWEQIEFGTSNPILYATLHANVASGWCGSNIRWILDDTGTLAIYGTGPMTDYAQYAPWYGDSRNIKTVIIESGVTSIGVYAFTNCTNLTSVTIPDSISSIGKLAFANCSSLTAVNIPDRVISIDQWAFMFCTSLTSVTIPNSVTAIDKYAFYECTSLKNVYYAADSSKWKTISIGNSNENLINATIHYNHIHDYSLISPVTVAATCTQNGYTEYTCTFGETYRDNIIPQLGHDYIVSDTVVAPTCEEQGYTVTICARCGETSQTGFVSALGHKMTQVPAVIPTCTESGWTQGTSCERCHFVGLAQTEIPALGHKKALVSAVAPTCTAIGWNDYEICFRCDYTTYAEIEALGHNMITNPAVAPTCTETGLTEGIACQRCQLAEVTQTEVPALGHSYADGVCTACGAQAYIPGDLDGVEGITEDDAIYLLQAILMPEFFPVAQPVDYDGNGEITEDDAIYLLQHVLMPDLFPL